MRRIKAIIALVLVLVMVLSMLPASTAEEEEMNTCCPETSTVENKTEEDSGKKESNEDAAKNLPEENSNQEPNQKDSGDAGEKDEMESSSDDDLEQAPEKNPDMDIKVLQIAPLNVQSGICPHDNREKHGVPESGYDFDKTSYVDNLDGKTHSVKRRTMDFIECLDCGSTWYEYGEWETVNEDHELYVNDQGVAVCCWCKAKISCTHAKKVKLYSNYDYNFKSYVDNQDSKTHSVERRTCDIMKCVDCGATWSENYGPWENIIMEHNLFKSELGAYCIMCHAEVSCSHKNKCKKLRDFEELGWGDNKDGKTHFQFRRYFDIMECSDCGCIWYENYGQWVKYTEYHDLEKDDYGAHCYKCQALVSCSHANKINSYSYYYSIKYGSYVDNQDGKTHDVEKKNMDHMMCNDCGCEWDIASDEWVTVTENHDLEKDDQGAHCTACSAQVLCSHTNKIKKYSDYENDWNSYADKGDGTHSVKRRTYDWMNCSDCGCEWGENYGEWKTEIEEHNWTDDGHGVVSCYDCGAINACKHMNFRTNGNGYSCENVTDNEDGTHSFDKTRTQDFYCEDCGYRWDETIGETVRVTKEHEWFDDERGRLYCFICNATNACTHSNAVTDSGVEWGNASDNGDGKTHTTEFRTLDWMICPDCGYEWDTNYSAIKTVVADHSWDSNGQCYCCGVTQTCQHVNVQSQGLSYEQYETAKDNINGTHSYRAKEKKIYDCLDCGCIWEVFTGKTELITERHDWDEDGLCYTCGARNTCQHAHTSVVDEVYEICSSVDNGDGTHSYERKLSNWVECLDCGYDWEEYTGTKQQVLNEKHFWYGSYEDGCLCFYCHAINTCKHGNAKISYTDCVRTDAKDTSKAYHTGNERTYNHMTCPDCGYEWDEYVGTWRAFKEKHIWVKHKTWKECSECGRIEKINDETESTIEVGDHVAFGRRPLNEDGTKTEQMKWKVLAIRNGKALLLCKNCITDQPYGSGPWSSSDLRTWLNSTFLESAFSSKEQKAIANLKVKADRNSQYETNPGTNTKDKVFLLSVSEAEKYFGSDEERKATSFGVENDQGVTEYKPAGWWLRTPGQNDGSMAFVNVDGSIDENGSDTNSSMITVRPAMWVNLSSLE